VGHDVLMGRVLVLAAVLAGGCYQPRVAACQLSCGTGGTCPDGLVCSTTGDSCVVHAEDVCGAPLGPDAPIVPTVDVNPGCTFHPSNVDACTLGLDKETTVLTVTTPSMTITTGDPQTVPPLLGGMTATVINPGAEEIVVFAFGHIIVPPNTTLVVQGARPLILLASETIEVDGDILVSPMTRTPGGCHAGIAGGNSVGGGGGGGFGEGGGPGGPLQNTTAAGGGGPSGMPTLIPLRGGCPGGTGATTMGTTPGGAGLGGGALQLSTAGTLTVVGQIAAPGNGGAGNAMNGGGAGGGGSGGAILLEGRTISVISAAALCANGGAGGTTAPTKPAAVNGSCSVNPTQSAAGSNRGGAGGAAGGVAGSGATSNSGSSFGAGGGGGGVGRIRINGAYTPSAAVVSPIPSTNP